MQKVYRRSSQLVISTTTGRESWNCKNSYKFGLVVKLYRGSGMTEQEVREAMKLYKLSFLQRPRKSHDYVYAARKVHGQRQEVYIGSLASLESMTVETLVDKLTLTENCSAAAPGKAVQAEPGAHPES